MDVSPSTRPCTWVACRSPAQHVLRARDGQSWADLCDAHKAEFDGAIAAMDARATLRAWVRAQGGAEKAAERMRPVAETAGRLFELLRGREEGLMHNTDITVRAATPVIGSYFVECEVPLPGCWADGSQRTVRFDQVVHHLADGRLVIRTASHSGCVQYQDVPQYMADKVFAWLAANGYGRALPAEVVQRLKKTTFAGMDEGVA